MFYRRSKRRAPPRVQSEISLSTISEEPSQYQTSAGNTPTPTPTNNPGIAPHCSTSICPTPSPQHEIVVQPEFVVETTITNNPVNCNNNNYSTTTNSSVNNFQVQRDTSETPTSDVIFVKCQFLF